MGYDFEVEVYKELEAFLEDQGLRKYFNIRTKDSVMNLNCTVVIWPVGERYQGTWRGFRVARFSTKESTIEELKENITKLTLQMLKVDNEYKPI